MKYLKYIFLLQIFFLTKNIQAINIENLEDKKGYYRTLNKKGWANYNLDDYTKEFINFASHTKGWCLEIGAAYGFASHEAVENGANMIVNDLDRRHLDYFKQHISDRRLSHIRLKPGNFLTINIKEESVDAILISRVLHLLHGYDIEKSANLMYKWLKKGGRLYITVSTPHQENAPNLSSYYEKGKSQGLTYPGEIKNTSKFFPNEKNQIPSFIHLLDLEILKKIFTNAGFKLEKSSYFDDNNINYNTPQNSLGIIFIK